MNYAVVGNLSPHIHLHLVPQFFSDDPTLPLNMQAGARRRNISGPFTRAGKR
jgi:diadenosine tetraphosphate (Ap4A) HIT family hydrolase